MINFRVQSVDGLGDRDDIALERDKQQGVIEDNKRQKYVDIDLAVNSATEWGTSGSAKPLSQIIQSMLEGEIYQKLILKSEVIWDTETVADALNEACVQLGLSDEEFAPSYYDQRNEIDLRLV